MSNQRPRDSLVTFIGITILCACSSNDAAPSQAIDETQSSIGGLPNYGYAGNVSYGGYSSYAGQPWGGVNSAATGGTPSASAATGGMSASDSGGATATASGGSLTGGATATASGGSFTGGASNTSIVGATGGRSSVGGASNTGGKASGGVTSTGGKSSAGGATPTGGVTSTGGKSSAGGATSTGGKSSAGGATSTDGKQSTGGALATGGLPSTGGALATGGLPSTGGAAAFNWGSVTYSPTGGSAVNHQGHNTGAACLASCHSHNFQAGGTIYQTNGTTTAGNVQVGIIMNGTLFTAYSGTQGNFFLPVTGTLNWATALIAIRTATGTAIHPATTGLSGNCNSCHNSSNRIVVP